MGNKTSSEIYTDSASFGKIYAIISAVIGSIICIGLFGFGIYIILHKNHLKSINGTVNVKR